MIDYRKEILHSPALPEGLRILHLSDVHFSRSTTHAQNLRRMEEILPLCKEADLICMTGDLVSRKWDDHTLPDAAALMKRLRECAPVAYSMGNHEMDLPQDVRREFLGELASAGITVLDNRIAELAGVTVGGLTLPQTVYKNPDGTYLHLQEITAELVQNCLPGRPQILLAHSPIGFAAYAQSGAALVLSGHVHGGIIRIGGIGLLSPERRFLPKYTKGLHTAENGCVMNVSAGIGKLRVHNPAEVTELLCHTE